MRIPSTFEKGLNTDLATSKRGNNYLTNGLNIELTTNLEIGSTLSIANIRGNKLYLTFPDTKNIYKFIPVAGSNTITLNGHSYTFTVGNTPIIQTVTQLLKQEYASELAGQQFKIQSNNQYILIISTGIDPLPSATGGTITTFISAQVDLSCIGYTAIKEKLVLFTTNKDNRTPTDNINNIGQVWLIDFDYLNNAVTNTVGPSFNLSLNTHWIYEGALDFYLINEIYDETIGRQENIEIGRAYFTDDYNYVRVMNCYNPDLFAVPPQLLDIKPAYATSIPIVTQIADGGNIPTGSIQAAYYLKTKDGGITNYSPKSNLVQLTTSGIQTLYVDYEGSPSGINSNKAVTFTINNVDTLYDYLVLAIVEYSTENVPLIYDVAEIAINGPTVEYTYTGSEQKVPVTISDFVNPRVQFKTAKSITYKRNRMYAANTKTPNLLLDWDARAYRFKRVALNPGFLIWSRVYSKDGSYKEIDTNFQIYNENGVSVTPYNISDLEDLVNPYNDESGTVYGTQSNTPDYSIWQTQYQYKFQADGVTLGGEGPNIKYSFISHVKEGDIQQNPFPGTPNVDGKFYRVFPLASNFTGQTSAQLDPGTPTLNTNFLGVNNQVYPIAYPWQGNKNPYEVTLFAGYARGEVYRIGITFVTNRGEEYETKWIGDIRFPEPFEGTSFHLSNAPNNLGPQNLITLGLQITIKDTSQLPANIAGFYFTRVERKSTDKTKLGQGLQLFPLKTGQARFNFDNGSADDVNTFQDSPSGQSLLGINTNDNIQINGFANDCYYLGIKLPTRPFNDTFDSFTGAHYGACASSWVMAQNCDPTISFGSGNSSKLFTIKSPENDFDMYNFDASYLKLMHFYQSTESNYFDPELTGVTFGDLTSNADTRVDAWWVKLMKTKFTADVVTEIDKHTQVDIETIIPASYHPYMQHDYYNIAIRPDDVAGEVSGGGAKHIFGITKTDNLALKNGPEVNYPNQYLHRVVSMAKYNFGQYGGPWRVNRYSNIYIQANHFQPIDTINNPQQTTLVFGGDTRTVFYSTVLYCFPWIEDYNVPERGGVGSGLYPGYRYTDDMKAAAFVFPCECSINTEYRYGQYWNKSQVPIFNSTKFALFQFDEFLYNTAYSQENNIKTFLSSPVNFNPVEEQPHTTWVSNLKLDGETTDQWRIFPINQQKDAEGVYGPITRIINFKDNILCYQERALSILNSQQVSSVQTDEGQAFTVGLGDLLAFYDYSKGSVKTGSRHQFSIFKGSDSVYHWDARLQKIFKFTEAISDIEGLSGFFRQISKGNISDIDAPLLRTGVHGAYDAKYNKAYFTFHNFQNIACIPFSPALQTFEIVTPNFSILSNLLRTGDLVSVVPDVTGTFPNNVTGEVTIDYVSNKAYIKLINVFGTIPEFRANIYIEHTIVYNRLLDCFESETSFKPTLYLSTDEFLLTANPFDKNNSLWWHNVGNYGQFYNNTYDWYFEFLVNMCKEDANFTGRINYIEFWSQILNFNNQDVLVSPLDSVTLSTDYQSTLTSLQSLTLNQNIKKFERDYRINQIYDQTITGPVKPYLRDKFVKIKAGASNTNNLKKIINNWNTDIEQSKH